MFLTTKSDLLYFFVIPNLAHRVIKLAHEKNV